MVAHMQAAEVPIAVPSNWRKLRSPKKVVALHYDFHRGFDSLQRVIFWEVRVGRQLVEPLPNNLDGMFSIDVGVHRDRVSGPQEGPGGQVLDGAQPIKDGILFCEISGNEGGQEAQVTVQPFAPVVDPSSAAGHNWPEF